MTKKEDDVELCKPRVAGLLAVHLVSQILEEAYVIANAAEESGQPWRYLSMLKNLRCGKLADVEEDISFVASKGDSDSVNENNIELVANVVATSTPQKLADGSTKPKTEPTLIGQGDEEFDTQQSELSKSTSMFINHLFDMSEVEKVIICDDTEILQSNPAPEGLLTQAMMTIMESYVNTAFNIAFEQEPQVTELQEVKSPRVAELSFLTDAFGGDIGKDIAFYIDGDTNSAQNNNYEVTEVIEEISKVTEEIEVKKEIIEENVQKNDVAFYENAYLTLNRDYDQGSDDDGDPVLQDPKGMMLQEVALTSTNSSEENVSAHLEEQQKQEERKELAAVSAVSGVSGSRKSKTSLMSRCRSKGARLLSCLRGWWRRKTPGKRREARQHGSICGMCPLSPDARRRASSLLDQRKLYSPTPSRSVVWKFNTVNETLVHSSRWKEYTFEMKSDECGEY